MYARLLALYGRGFRVQITGKKPGTVQVSVKVTTDDLFDVAYLCADLLDKLPQRSDRECRRWAQARIDDVLAARTVDLLPAGSKLLAAMEDEKPRSPNWNKRRKAYAVLLAAQAPPKIDKRMIDKLADVLEGLILRSVSEQEKTSIQPSEFRAGAMRYADEIGKRVLEGGGGGDQGSVDRDHAKDRDAKRQNRYDKP